MVQLKHARRNLIVIVVKVKTEKFFCYDIRRDGIRNFHVDNIIFVEETENTFYPRWIVEV